jgi:dihydrolipoamide dehydrogenase
MPDFDVLIIGAGPGGYVAAIRSAQLGMKTAVIEKDALGGVCLNWGCIPSKALLYCAELAHLFRRAPEFGIGYENLKLDLGVAVDRSREVAAKMVGGVETLLQQNKVTVINGTGKLKSATEVRVEPGGETVSAKNVIVASGGVTRSLPNVPIDGDRVITSREALELREIPRSIVVVGAGPVGIEFAYLYRAYGSEVTVLEMLNHALPAEDVDVSRALERALKAQGIEIKTGVRVEDVKVGEGGVSVTYASGESRQELQAERVLIGVGFGANTEGLGLDTVGVEMERGWVKVDEYCQTSVPGLYAIGDVTGKLLLAHVASHQGVTAVERICGLNPPPLDYVRMPRAVYCEPQVGSLGLTEAQAREKGLNVRVGRFPFRGNGKALAIGETEGFVKLVVDQDTREIVGYHAIGYGATEMLAEASLGATLETTPAELGFAVHAHPTLSEVVKEAALAVDGEAIHFYAPLREKSR